MLTILYNLIYNFLFYGDSRFCRSNFNRFDIHLNNPTEKEYNMPRAIILNSLFLWLTSIVSHLNPNHPLMYGICIVKGNSFIRTRDQIRYLCTMVHYSVTVYVFLFKYHIKNSVLDTFYICESMNQRSKHVLIKSFLLLLGYSNMCPLEARTMHSFVATRSQFRFIVCTNTDHFKLLVFNWTFVFVSIVILIAVV